MRRFFRQTIGAAVVALAIAVPQIGVAAELSGPKIRETLVGNSVKHPVFGCLHYATPNAGMRVVADGRSRQFFWWIRGGRYFSTGECGKRKGCRVTRRGNMLEYISKDGRYRQKALLQSGNRCEGAPAVT